MANLSSHLLMKPKLKMFRLQKIYRSQVAGKTKRKASQQQHEATTPEFQDALTKLALAEKEIEHLRAQLASEKALVAAKDDFITLLRASYNRPN